MSSTDVLGEEDQRQQKKKNQNLEDIEESGGVGGGLFRKILASAEKAMTMAANSSSPRRDTLTVEEDDDEANRRLSQRYRPGDSKERRRPLRRLHLEEGGDEKANDDDQSVRDGYRRRLATYGPHNFFGKPPSLSPVVCARFGWKVKENDVLECEDCGATWRVEFPPNVQGRAARRLTELYEVEVSSKHCDAAMCRRYGTEARLYREERLIESTRNPVVPSWERRLLPNAFVPIVTRATRLLLNDPVRCREWFQGRYDAVLQALTGSLPSDKYEWSWSLPDSVRYYKPEEDAELIGSGTAASPFVSSGQSNLLARILEVVSRVERSSDGSLLELRSLQELSAALVLFGWSDSLLEQHSQSVASPPIARDAPATAEITTGDPRRSIWRLTCRFTLSALTLEAREKQEMSGPGRSNSEKNVAAKNDVFNAHRYYSPYICGFPITMSDGDEVSQPAAATLPIWKCLAARVLHVPASSERPGGPTPSEKAETSDGVAMEPYEAFEQALSMLRSTVSPRLKRQRLHGSHVVPT